MSTIAIAGDLKTHAARSLAAWRSVRSASSSATSAPVRSTPLKTALDWAGGGATPEVASGMLSLIVWTLLITTSIKYVAVVMRADNDGEGGILALMALLGIKHAQARRRHRARAARRGLALRRRRDHAGDLRARARSKGSNSPVPGARSPMSCRCRSSILIGLFALQPQGTRADRPLFGPIMTVWFIIIGVLGIARHRCVIQASCWRSIRAMALAYLFTHGFHRLSCARCGVPVRYRRRGALCRYGPFRTPPDPPRMVWSRTARCSCSTMRARPRWWSTAPSARKPTHSSCCVPAPLQVPLVVLATVATIIASQSIISGAFSMTRQAIQLGLCPRLQYHPDLGRGLRADLCRLRQLGC